MRLHETAEAEMPEPVAWVRERERTAARLALSLVGFDTQNPPGHTAEIVDWIEGRFREWGIETERIVADSTKPNLVATIPGESDRTLLFNGHLDTVPYRSGRWSYDPLGEREGDRIYGRGAEDMKGPIASLLLAARAFAETGVTPPVTVRFAFVADEETGGEAGTATLLDQEAVDPEACVVTETTSAADRRSVTVAERGKLWLTLEARGRAAHGSRPMLGINAIDRLDGAIEACREAIDDRELSIEPVLEPVIEESVEYYAPSMGRETAQAMFERPTANLGTFNGGESINSVPERAVAELDVRLAPGVDPTDMLQSIRDVLDGHDHVAIREIDSTTGTFEAADSPVVNPTLEAARRVTGDRIYRRCASGGSDARLFRNAGIPSVEFGLGIGNAHATNEHTTVETIVGNAAVYSLLPWLW